MAGARELGEVSHRGANPIMKAPPARPNHLPEAPYPNTIAFQHTNFVGDTNLQIIATEATVRGEQRPTLSNRALGLLTAPEQGAGAQRSRDDVLCLRPSVRDPDNLEQKVTRQWKV